jgi:hypothetical protein
MHAPVPSGSESTVVNNVILFYMLHFFYRESSLLPLSRFSRLRLLLILAYVTAATSWPSLFSPFSTRRAITTFVSQFITCTAPAGRSLKKKKYTDPIRLQESIYKYSILQSTGCLQIMTTCRILTAEDKKRFDESDP